MSFDRVDRDDYDRRVLDFFVYSCESGVIRCDSCSGSFSSEIFASKFHNVRTLYDHHVRVGIFISILLHFFDILICIIFLI